jgi:hypothetical protein
VLVFGAASRLLADDKPPQPPQPGPEMDIYQHMVGTWDCTVKMAGSPESKATATYKLECGGMWLAEDFKGDFGGMAFQGKGMDSYDQNKKKYVSVWMDSMSSSPMISEGVYDADKKTMTMTGEMVGMDGKPGKVKMVTEQKDDDTAVFNMYTGGSDTPMMTITYKRQK